MAKLSRNFIAGRMNKIVDERLLPEGEYIHAMNIRMGNTEKSEVGVIENTKGNLVLTALSFDYPLSQSAKCIGAVEDSENNIIYWFVHDSNYPAYSGVCDMIVSYNVYSDLLTYHVISIDDNSGNERSILNFNEKYLITGVNLIGDLLFFTDDYNPPRVINVKRKYPTPAIGIDQITREELLVIKKPPTESPTVVPIVTSGQENYLDTRFISFAYRYRYIDGEYSATSQWSQIAFVPKNFNFSVNSMLNEGMTNACNTAVITYNSGGPLVVGIDLLFKQSANNVIKVIEKLDKQNLGLSNNTDYTYSFNNSKIFTVLSESEILRLYDNVPRLAKAQTIMGNRLMYGNYVEGYDLISANGYPLRLEYSTETISEDIGSYELLDTLGNGNYTINGSQTIGDSIFYIDLTGRDLVEGALISIQITFAHATFTGTGTFPTETTNETNIDFNFYLSTSYASVYDMASSTEFQNAVGTALNIKPVYSGIPGTETSCDGITLTDAMNCIIPNNLSSLTKYASGISGQGQPIAIITSPSSNLIGFQFIAMRYVNSLTTPTINVYEYYKATFVEANYQEIASPQSLHSNRGYEIGIVYMDEFNRSTTALVSPDNTEYIPCGLSSKKNSIHVTIPTSQVAPAWAKRYKFVIKPDAENYDVIYSNLFVTDPNTNEVWFFLEGENAKKIETGDRLIVKADSSGPVLNCAYATVLAKESKAAGFVAVSGGGTAPAGVYMKINPNSFNAVVQPDAHVNFGIGNICAEAGGNYSYLQYGLSKGPVAGLYSDYSIPAGSVIRIYLNAERLGVRQKCERKGYLLEKTYISSNNYDSFEEWFNGDNIGSTLNTGSSYDGTTVLQYIPTNGIMSSFAFDTIYLQFYRSPIDNQLVLQTSTGESCTGIGSPNSRAYCVTMQIEVFRAIDTIIFETEPTDALPDVFYENNLSFAIDELGNHMGNIQNQDINTGTPAIIDTKFFNCFSFGNGAESYKIRDSIVGRYFTLGERVTTVSAQDYKESDRYADITYSGIFNAETNVNKLNEFNMGLLNYKNLERSFGTIYILDGRETDVLVLQEDKISYVLAGKNLLSDSAAGGAIASVPEVLGTQIARTEKYGISFNPESYVQWGFNRYFTDVKRGAVLQLIGDSYSNEQIKVISEQNMRTWFRDEFNESFNKQKLGGFDPYMNEYVLSGNDTELPIQLECLECGITQTFNLTKPEDAETAVYSYCVNLGENIGITDVSWVVNSGVTVKKPAGCEFKIEVIYEGGDGFDSGWVTGSSEGSFDKNSVSVKTATVIITYECEAINISVTIGCPQPEPMTIVEVVLTNNVEAGKTIHTQFRYQDGTYTGPLQSDFVEFISSVDVPTVSRYNLISGNIGSGIFAPEGSTMTLRTNKISSDDFDFNLEYNKFKYLRSNVLYENNSADIVELLDLSNEATPIVNANPIYSAQFIVPDSSIGQYLYLIWDLRIASTTLLCYSEMDVENPIKTACCSCTPCSEGCVSVRITNSLSGKGIPVEVYFPNGQGGCGAPPGPFSIEVPASEIAEICVANDFEGDGMWQIVSGVGNVEIIGCGCTNCAETCSQWYYLNNSLSKAFVSFNECGGSCEGEPSEIEIQAGRFAYINACVDTIPVVTEGSASNLFLTNYCGACDFPVCVKFEVYDITGDTSISYVQCEGGYVSFFVTTGGSYEPFCVDYPYLPTVSDPTKAKIRIFEEGCDCAIIPPL